MPSLITWPFMAWKAGCGAEEGLLSELMGLGLDLGFRVWGLGGFGIREEAHQGSDPN